MGVAKFTAKDPYIPSATLEELYEILSEMDGVLDWSVNEAREVAVEYDHYRINDQMIEKALSGIGFEIKHVSDNPDLPDELAREVLDEEESVKDQE